MISMRRALLIAAASFGLVMCFAVLSWAQQVPTPLQKGLELQKAGKLDQAMKAYQEELQSNPGNIKVLIALATVYYSMMEYERAAAAFQNVLGLNPNSTNAQIYIALCKLHMGLPDEASNDLQRILIDHPDNTKAMLSLGVAQVAAGYPNTAIETFNKVLEMGGENVRLRETVRRMMRIAGEYAQAREKQESLAVMSRLNNTFSEAALAARIEKQIAETQDDIANLSPAQRMALMDAMFWDGGDDEAQRIRPDFLKR